MEGLCGTCLERPDPQVLTLHRFEYDGVMKEIVRAYKFHFYHYLCRSFAYSLFPLWNRVQSEFQGADVVPVPAHPLRRFSRRFDSVRLMARMFAELIDAPFQDLLIKTRHRPAQTQLSAADRKTDRAGIYRCRSSRIPGRVILIDDVYTTGTTVRSCVNALMRDGVGEVAVITLCRTPS